MLNLELLAQSGDHNVIQVCTVVCDDPVGDTIPAYEVLLDEAGNHILCNGGEGRCFDPLVKVIPIIMEGSLLSRFLLLTWMVA